MFINADEHPVLIIVPFENMPFEVVHLCRTCSEKAGLTLLWARESNQRGDGWLLLKLLQNAGATVCETLDSLALTARLFQVSASQNIRFSSVAQVAVQNAVMAHLSDAITDVTDENANKNAPQIKMNKSAQLVATIGKKSVPVTSSPSVLGDALTKLCGHFSKQRPKVASPEITYDVDIIEMIARPPARILSETASKRLLGAFGLETPKEMLCDSPSKAVRFAKSLDGPATLKLVRPNFRFKTSLGGVIHDVTGPSEIQKAYQSLLTLSADMGGGRALGILVCEQIETAHQVWLDARRHNALGRIVYFGKRSETTEQPDGVLTLPCSLQNCVDAICRAFPEMPEPASNALANAMFRFGAMCTHLGEQVGLAQIHPLAITPAGALMLDAVVGITDYYPER